MNRGYQPNLDELATVLNRLDPVDTARILEALLPEDRLLAWKQVREERLDAILLLLTDDIREELPVFRMQRLRAGSRARHGGQNAPARRLKQRTGPPRLPAPIRKAGWRLGA